MTAINMRGNDGMSHVLRCAWMCCLSLTADLVRAAQRHFGSGYGCSMDNTIIS